MTRRTSPGLFSQKPGSNSQTRPMPERWASSAASRQVLTRRETLFVFVGLQRLGGGDGVDADGGNGERVAEAQALAEGLHVVVGAAQSGGRLGQIRRVARNAESAVRDQTSQFEALVRGVVVIRVGVRAEAIEFDAVESDARRVVENLFEWPWIRLEGPECEGPGTDGESGQFLCHAFSPPSCLKVAGSPRGKRRVACAAGGCSRRR